MKVAEWWHYDEHAKTLFYEETGAEQPELKVAQTILVPTSVESAWEATSKEGEKVLLWCDKELSPGKNLVAEVRNWDFDTNLSPTIIRGNNQDGGYFEDSVRLLIPLLTGSFIAISERNRHYFLIAQNHGKKPVRAQKLKRI